MPESPIVLSDRAAAAPVGAADVTGWLQAFTGPLDAATALALADEMSWVSLRTGQLLFAEGEAGDAVYFVASGCLRVSIVREDGRVVRIGEVGPGEPVGEMALLSGDPRSASVHAESETSLLRLSRAGFAHLVARAPQALGYFARTMAGRLARSGRARVAVAAIRSSPFVTLTECDEAVRTTNPVMLNLRITQLYHRLALDLTTQLGAQDVNWFGFACRASKTAGSAIRGEDVPLLRPAARFIAGRLSPAAIEWIRGWRLTRRVDTALAAVSDRIAEGNRLIFAEIGPVFVRLVEALQMDASLRPTAIARLLASLTPGAAEQGGQDLLRAAVQAYAAAASESHPKRRAELILLGSLQIGLHEQIRVDPLIDDALDRPMTELVGTVAPWLRRLPASWRADERARTAACRRARRLVTARIMRIRLPYGDLRLGDDLPALPAQRRFPDLLATLEHPELAALFQRFDGGGPTRAVDWSELGCRMRYIANFFRSRQKSLELFEPPFLFDQQTRISAGEVPDGVL